MTEDSEGDIYDLSRIREKISRRLACFKSMTDNPEGLIYSMTIQALLNR